MAEAAREIELSTKQQTTAVEQVNMAIYDAAQAAKETEASSRQPVSDVQILVVGTPSGAITNASGEFVIQNVTAGARTLRARRIGFAPVDRRGLQRLTTAT